MRLRNPHFINAKAAAIGAKIRAAMQAETGREGFTLDELKERFKSDAEDLTPGMLSEIAQRQGWAIEP